MLEVSGAQSDLASKSAQIGLGVNLAKWRAFNAYLASSTNTAESKFEVRVTVCPIYGTFGKPYPPNGG